MNRLKDKYLNEVTPSMMEKFDYKSIMETPKVDKIIINMGVGDAVSNAKNLDKVDLLKIDVEGHELDVLKSFDFEKYHPSLIITEDNFKDSNKSVRYFLASKGYAVIARDRINYWFAPKSKVKFFLNDYLNAKFRFFRWDLKRSLYNIFGKKVHTGNY